MVFELNSRDKDKIARGTCFVVMPGGKAKKVRNRSGLGAAKGNGRRPSRRADGYPPHRLLVLATRTIKVDLAGDGLSTDFLATAHPVDSVSESDDTHNYDGPSCPYTGERKPFNGVVKGKSACGLFDIIVEYKYGVVFSAHTRPRSQKNHPQHRRF